MKTRSRQQRGFTLLEVLIALTVTVIGLLGVIMMQPSTVRSNRETQQFTRAANFAEEIMERTRGMSVVQLQGGALSTLSVNGGQPVNGTVYTVTGSAVDITASTNLVLVTITVSYSDENDSSTVDDRQAVVQMVRTRTEIL